MSVTISTTGEVDAPKQLVWDVLTELTPAIRIGCVF